MFDPISLFEAAPQKTSWRFCGKRCVVVQRFHIVLNMADWILGGGYHPEFTKKKTTPASPDFPVAAGECFPGCDPGCARLVVPTLCIFPDPTPRFLYFEGVQSGVHGTLAYCSPRSIFLETLGLCRLRQPDLFNPAQLVSDVVPSFEKS